MSNQKIFYTNADGARFEATIEKEYPYYFLILIHTKGGSYHTSINKASLRDIKTKEKIKAIPTKRR